MALPAGRSAVSLFTTIERCSCSLFGGGGEPEAHGVAAQKAILSKRFAGDAWEVPRILTALDSCDDLYFDRVSQIHMDAWS
jgi:hypothetical protein